MTNFSKKFPTICWRRWVNASKGFFESADGEVANVGREKAPGVRRSGNVEKLALGALGKAPSEVVQGDMR